MNITLSAIGEKLIVLRTTLGLSQKNIADAMGVSQTQISKMENGKGGSIDLLLQVFEFYGGTHQVKFVFTDAFEVVMPPQDPTTTLYNNIALEKLTLLEGEITHQFSEVKKLLRAVR
ncbi:helix-turn-helix domain-containing protein [Pontibacter rugosus]|uniref:Helix-turn-helix domain-containing protein n=1 Tax=Pontibacter rugosus TaxID=1745966 RepID=A0ABW3SRY7_9BACT